MTLRRLPAPTVVPALADPTAWPAGSGRVPLAAMSDVHLGAVLATLEDRAEELYRAATGRPAASCMAATVWLYGQPFCDAAVRELGRRGLDLVSVKQEARAALGPNSGPTAAVGAEDWLA